MIPIPDNFVEQYRYLKLVKKYSDRIISEKMYISLNTLDKWKKLKGIKLKRGKGNGLSYYHI